MMPEFDDYETYRNQRNVEWIKKDIKFEETCGKLYRKKLAEHKKVCNSANCRRCIALDKLVRNSEYLLDKHKKELAEAIDGEN